MNRVIEFLDKVIEVNSTIVIACSGGPDSMCLLNLLISIRNKKELNLIVAHVNHKIRKESDNEALLVKKFCEENRVIFEYKELNEYKKNKFSEEDAHKKRYAFFREIIKKYNAKYLVTAHHGDDLIETILMRISRGSNLSGYVGIKSVSENKDYITLRPLLFVSKDEIIQYNKEHSIDYVIDESNNSLDYTRNRYRHVVLPFLKKEDKNIHLKYLKFSKELEETDEFINNYIYDKKIIIDNYIVINKLKDEKDIIKKKSIELLVKDIQKKDYFDISDRQMNELMKLLNNKNKSIDLNNNYQGVNEYGVLKIIKKKNSEYLEVVFDKNIEFNDFIFYYDTNNGDNSNNTIYINNEDIVFPLKLRTRLDGDKILVKNLKGSKKVNDIFIDEKINKEKRDRYPLLVDANNNIIWIPGLKKSQFCKDKSEKYDIIIKCEAR